MFALDSLYSHYAGIFLEKDSYGRITNIQSCILSGFNKKNPELNLEISFWRGFQLGLYS